MYVPDFEFVDKRKPVIGENKHTNKKLLYFIIWGTPGKDKLY